MRKDRRLAYWSYLFCVTGSGFTLLALSILEMNQERVSNYWLVLAFLTAIISAFAIKIPEIDSRISIEDTLVFTNLVLFGPQAGVVTAALQGLMGSIRAKSVRKRPEFALFNAGALALAAYISGRTFFTLLGGGPLFTRPGMSLGKLALPIGAMALVHYLCNSSTVAVIIALDLRKKIYHVWAKNFRWTWISYLAGAFVAALVAVNLRSGDLAVLGALIPFMLVIYFSYRTYREKLEGQVQSFRELTNLYHRTVESLALAVDAKDQSTYGHVQRVRAYALGLARLCNITNTDELLAIDTGSLLHDIGKLAVNDYILNKPGRLSPKEFEAMKIHSVAGEEILDLVRFPYPVGKIVRAHHERWDGKGYPDGLTGEEIPLAARILMIADTYDALRSPRPYKAARGIQESIQELRNGVRSMYDPNLVELFLNNIDQLEAEAEEAVRNMPQLSYRANSGKSDSCISTADPYESAPALPQSLKSSVELVSLCEFCTSLAGHLSLPDLLVNLGCRLRRLLPFTSWAFFLDDGSNTLCAAHAGGKFADQLQNLRIDFGSGISGWVATYGRPMINPSVSPEFERLQGDFSSLASALVVPINRNRVCLGTISLYAESPVTYSDEHLEILQVVANQVEPVLAIVQNRTASSFPKDLLDPVTEAYQASYLAFAGTEMIASCRNSASHFSLIYLDLRNFQEIVELFGPHIGDSVLRKVAEILKSEIREKDVFVRFGQQGFVVLLAGIQKHQISRRIQHIGPQISEMVVGNMPAIACQAGMASYPEDGVTIVALLDAARRALEADSQRACGPQPEGARRRAGICGVAAPRR